MTGRDERRAAARQARATARTARRALKRVQAADPTFTPHQFRIADPRGTGRYYLVDPAVADHVAVARLAATGDLPAAAAALLGPVQGARFLATHPTAADAIALVSAALDGATSQEARHV